MLYLQRENMTLHRLFFEWINYIVTNYPSDVRLSSVTVDVASMAGDRVEVSRNLFHPCPALAAQLSAMNIMLRCTDNGKRFYMLVIQLVGQHLKLECIDCSNE